MEGGRAGKGQRGGSKRGGNIQYHQFLDPPLGYMYIGYICRAIINCMLFYRTTWPIDVRPTRAYALVLSYIGYVTVRRGRQAKHNIAHNTNMG